MGDKRRSFYVAGALVIASIFGLTALGVRSRMVQASVGPYAEVSVPNLTLAPAQSPAVLSHDSALAVVEKRLSPGMFKHPFTFKYGSFGFSGVGLRTGGPGSAVQQVGTRDVWKVTFTGLRLSRPCGSFFKVGAPPPKCPPPVRTLAVFVDDKSGQLLESEGY